MSSKYKQELNRQEEKLSRALARIYRNIKRDMSLELATVGRITWGDIQRIYRKRADDIIRSAVTATYEISARKTVERDIGIPFFLTEQDMSEIRRLTQRYTDWFWVGMEREIVKKSTAMAYDPNTFMRLDSSKLLLLQLKDTFIGRMTESLHGEIAAEAVISKARQVIITPSSSSARRGGGGGFYRRAAISEEEETSEPHFIWQTAEDEQVCEICGPLDGRVFALDNPVITTPVEDTHPRCRCELVLVDASSTTSAVSRRRSRRSIADLLEFVSISGGAAGFLSDVLGGVGRGGGGEEVEGGEGETLEDYYYTRLFEEEEELKRRRIEAEEKERRRRKAAEELLRRRKKK